MLPCELLPSPLCLPLANCNGPVIFDSFETPWLVLVCKPGTSLPTTFCEHIIKVTLPKVNLFQIAIST